MFSKARKGYDKAEVDLFVSEAENTIALLKERIDELNKSNADLEGQLKEFKQNQDLIAKSIVNAVQKAEQIDSLTKKKYAFDMAQLKAFHDRWLSHYNKLISLHPLDGGLRGLKDFNKSMTDIFTGGSAPESQMREAEEQFKREVKRLESTRGKGKSDKTKTSAAPIAPKKDEEDYGIPVFNPEESIRDLLRRQLNEEGEKRQKREKDARDAVCPKIKKSEGDEDDFSAMTESPEGFSYEECLTPKQDLGDILKEIGIEFDS